MTRSDHLEELTSLIEREGTTVTLNMTHIIEGDDGLPEALHVESAEGTLAPLILTSKEWEEIARYLVEQRQPNVVLHKKLRAQQQNIVKLSGELSRAREQLDVTQMSLSIAESKAQTYLTALNQRETKEQ